MRETKRTRTGRGAVLTAAALLAAATGLRAESAADIVGAEDQNHGCVTCHAVEVEAWKASRHFATFVDRHRSDGAKEILAALGLRSMKRAEECNQCHYTSAEAAGRVQAISGVSCESCHSPARAWVDVHQKVGGDPAAPAIKWGTGKSESPGQRKARLGAAQKKGMLHSAMLYEIASNCFSCHTVPNEKVVNVGGHRPGSDFDLVAWSQGEVRHNFASSAGAPDAPTNRPATPEERRRLYVVGAMVDLETSLRNLASAKQAGGTFQKAMAARAAAARKKVAAILDKAELPELSSALAKVPAAIDASTKVDAAVPDALRSAARSFVQSRDGKGLAGIDPLIPTKTHGTPFRS
jgi:Cytochrome c554 and c-prime